MLHSIVALFNLELKERDINTTFIEFEKNIYIHQPEGFVVQEKKKNICLLKKFLYDLKQSPR